MVWKSGSPKHTYTQVLPQLGLPMPIWAQHVIWFFRDHEQVQGPQVKYKGAS